MGSGYVCGVLHVTVLMMMSVHAGAWQPLTQFPSDIASHAKWAALNYAWAASNERFGPRSQAGTNQNAADDHIHQMTMLGNGFIQPEAIDAFKWVCFNSAWAAANNRAYTEVNRGNSAEHDQYDQNMRQLNQHLHSLEQSPSISSTLAQELRWMCWNAAWYTANTRARSLDEDARNNLAAFNTHANAISAEAVLIDIQFSVDDLTVLHSPPSVVEQHTLSNGGSVEQEMTFSVSAEEGHTETWGHTWQFGLSVTETFEAGFPLVAAGGASVQFSASYSNTWSTSHETHLTRTYSFPVKVPPHCTYLASATVHQTRMSVPYTLRFRIGQSEYTGNGMWTGVAVSLATYAVNPVVASSVVQLLQQLAHKQHNALNTTKDGITMAVIFVSCLAFCAAVNVFWRSRTRAVTEASTPLLGA